MNREASDEFLAPREIIPCKFTPLDFSELNTPTFDSADSLTLDTPERVEGSRASLPADGRSLRWSQGEIQLLQELKEDDSLTYEQISECFARNGFSKSVESIQQRWTKVQRPGLLKGRMSYCEESKIIRIYTENEGNIREIARQMPSRSLMQIRRKCIELGLLRVPGGATAAKATEK